MLAKNKLISVEILIFKALINSNITDEEMVSKNNAKKEYNDIKEETKIF